MRSKDPRGHRGAAQAAGKLKRPGNGLHESPMIIRIGITPIGYCNMRIFLAGVRCVGKTTVGAKLADLLGYPFFDLDVEIERFFGTSIERLQNSYLTSHSFRIAASQALNDTRVEQFAKARRRLDRYRSKKWNIVRHAR